MSDELVTLARAILDTSGEGHVYPSHAICAMEDEVERRDLISQYIAALSREIGYRDPDPIFFWRLMRATPEQKARAFLMAVEGTQEG